MAGYADGEGRIWGLTGPSPTWSFETSAAALNGVAFDPDGSSVVAASADGLATVWRIPTTRNVPTGGQIPLPSLATALPDRYASGEVAFAQGNLFAATVGKGVGLWRLDHLSRIGSPIMVPTYAYGGCWGLSPDGKLLATGGCASGHPVTLWNVSRALDVTAAGREIASHNAYTFSPNGDWLALYGTGIELWNVRSGTVRRISSARGVSSLAFSSRSALLATGNTNGSIDLWSLSDANPRPRVLTRAASNPVGSGAEVVLSPDGRTLAAPLQDGVGLWDVTRGVQLGTLGTGVGADSLAFSPDGNILAAGQYNGGVQLFDVATEQPLGRPLVTAGGSGGMAFSSDGSLLATGGLITLIWDKLLWRSDEFAQRAESLCQLVGRNLSRTGWDAFVPGQPYERTCPEWP